MDAESKLMLFGAVQGSLWKALFAPARPRRGAARPGTAPSPELDADWPEPAEADPAHAAAAVTALLACTFTGAGH